MDYTADTTIVTTPRSPINSICIHKNHLLAASNQKNGFIFQYNLTLLNKSCLKGHSGGINYLASGTDAFYSASKDGDIREWSDFKCSGVLAKGHGSLHYPITMCLYSPHNLLYSGGNDNLIIAWDLQSKAPILRLQGHTGWVTSILSNVDGSLLFSASTDHTIKIWKSFTGECNVTLHAHVDWVLTIALHDHTLVSGSRDGCIFMWDYSNAKITKTLKTADSNSIHYLCFSNEPVNPQLFSMGDKNIISAWDTLAGKMISTYSGHFGSIRSCVLYNQWIFTGSRDGTIKKWKNDLKSNSQVDQISIENILFQSSQSSFTIDEWIENQKIIDNQLLNIKSLQLELSRTRAEISNQKIICSKLRNLEYERNSWENNLSNLKFINEELNSNFGCILDCILKAADKQMILSRCTLDEMDFLLRNPNSNLECLISRNAFSNSGKPSEMFSDLKNLFVEISDSEYLQKSPISADESDIGSSPISPDSVENTKYFFKDLRNLSSLEKMAVDFEKTVEKAIEDPWNFMPNWMKTGRAE